MNSVLGPIVMLISFPKVPVSIVLLNCLQEVKNDLVKGPIANCCSSIAKVFRKWQKYEASISNEM